MLISTHKPQVFSVSAAPMYVARRIRCARHASNPCRRACIDRIHVFALFMSILMQRARKLMHEHILQTAMRVTRSPATLHCVIRTSPTGTALLAVEAKHCRSRLVATWQPPRLGAGELTASSEQPETELKIFSCRPVNSRATHNAMRHVPHGDGGDILR